MTLHARRTAAAFLLACATSAAVGAAGPIYRCGHEYSQTPCPEGRLVERSDTRSARQRAEAQAVVARDQALGAKMERERRAQEAQAPAQAGVIHGRRTPVAPVATLPARAKPKKTAGKLAVFKPASPGAKPKRTGT